MKKFCLLVLISLIITGTLIAGGSSQTTPASSGGPVKITWWRNLDAKSAQVLTSWGENEGLKQIFALKNVDVEFVGAPIGQETEQFNLMIASRNVPDIIENGWRDYPGGPQKAIDDKIIMDLTDAMAKNAPNYTKLKKDNPNLAKAWTTLEGRDYMFGFARAPIAALYYGLQVRQDWLDKLNIKTPQNMQEFTQMLYAFRDRDPNGNGKADEIPFGHAKNWNSVYALSMFFGVGSTKYDNGFYVDKGQVKYSPIEPGFRDYLQMMSTWYKDKLIDPEFSVLELAAYEGKVYNNLIGSQYGGLGTGFMGKHNMTMNNQNNMPDFKMVGMLPPMDQNGNRRIMYDQDAPGSGAAISANTKYLNTIVDLLDYGYGPDGSFTINFGPAGKAAIMTPNGPQYTDLVLHSPDGLTYDVVMTRYGLITTGGPFIQNELHMYTSMSYNNVIQICYDMLNNCDLSWRLPPLPLSSDSARRVNDVFPDIKTYVDENVDLFIMGTRPMSQYDDFVRDIKNMGIDKVIPEYQRLLN
ncbi:MAG: hypothetical protein FWD78_10380 [Treponema sp.]|nr:hypothetical protein [Treponema sp.]